MRVSDLMSRPGITCHVHDNLNVPARLIWDHDCGAVAVVGDNGKLVGMITDRDVCMAAYTQDCPLGELEVNVAMARCPISARPDQDVEVVERAMAEHQVRRVPPYSLPDRAADNTKAGAP